MSKRFNFSASSATLTYFGNQTVGEVPGLGAMAASLVFLIATAVAYKDFKPLTLAWPSTKQFYLWSFFTLAASLLVQIVFLLNRDRDRIAGLVLGQPITADSHHESRAVSVGQ